MPGRAAHVPERVVLDRGSLDDAQRDHLLKVLNDTGWRIRGPRGAAEMLRVKPTTLETRMQKLGIKRPGKAGENRVDPTS